MFKEKNLSIFSSQMEAIVLITLQIFFATQELGNIARIFPGLSWEILSHTMDYNEIITFLARKLLAPLVFFMPWFLKRTQVEMLHAWNTKRLDRIQLFSRRCIHKTLRLQSVKLTFSKMFNCKWRRKIYFSYVSAKCPKLVSKICLRWDQKFLKIQSLTFSKKCTLNLYIPLWGKMKSSHEYNTRLKFKRLYGFSLKIPDQQPSHF